MKFFGVLALCAAVFFPLHIAATRLTEGRRLITVLLLEMVAATLAGTAFAWLLFHGRFSSPGAELVALVGGALAFFAYAGHYGLLGPSSVDRSVSAHIVALVYLAPNRRIKEADLAALYTYDDMLEKRYNDCVATGLMTREGQEFAVTPKGARIAWFYLTLGRFLGMRPWYLRRYEKTQGR